MREIREHSKQNASRPSQPTRSAPEPAPAPAPAPAPRGGRWGSAYAIASDTPPPAPVGRWGSAYATAATDTPAVTRSEPTERRSSKTKRVVIWDLDDTLILWDTLGPKYSPGCGVAEEDAAELFEQWRELSKEFQEAQFERAGVKDLQGDELQGHAPKPVHTLTSSPKYKHVIELLQRPSGDFCPPSFEKARKQLVQHTEKLSKGWLSAGNRAVDRDQTQEGTVNVIVTASRLIAAVTKLFLCGLNTHFQPEHIYSCWMRGTKTDAFKFVQRAFPRVELVAVGDGPQERDAAEALGIEFHRISNLADIQRVAKRLTA